MKPLAVVAGCVLVGLAAGGLWTLLQSDRYRADARVLVRPASARIVPAVEALAESSLVETNVAQTLHLPSPPKLIAKRGDSGVLTVSAAAGSPERARQIDAEAVVILMQKVSQRFGAVHASATILDPAHVTAQTRPTTGRNLLIAGLAGLLAGLAGAAALARPRAAATGAAADPRVERRLKARIDQVAVRERALAGRAGQLAAREHDLDRREAELERRLAEAAAPPRAPEAEPETEPAPTQEPEPAQPEPPVAQPPPAIPAGAWSLGALEERVRARRDRFPQQAEEWDTYLFFLRQHGDVDGALPRTFDSLIAEVFADAVAD